MLEIESLSSLILFLWTGYYWCIYIYIYTYSVLSPSAHLFSGHASCCQRSDRLIHAVFTVAKRFPSGLSPLRFSSTRFPRSSFHRFIAAY